MSLLRTGRSRASTRLDPRGWSRSLWRPGPERWVWSVSLAGWAVLMWSAVGWYPLGAQGSGYSWQHHAVLPLAPDAAQATPGALESAGMHLLLWVAMAAATMLPLIAGNLRTIGLRSPRSRRTLATVEVAAGWSAVWVAAGAAGTAALMAASAVLPGWVAVLLVCGAAVAWQFTRLRDAAVARCHRVLAPPLGRGASSACRRFGVSLGWASVLGCWPSMALMSLSGHNLLVVAVLGWLAWRDVRLPHNRPGRWTSAAVLTGVGAVVALAQI